MQLIRIENNLFWSKSSNTKPKSHPKCVFDYIERSRLFFEADLSRWYKAFDRIKDESKVDYELMTNWLDSWWTLLIFFENQSVDKQFCNISAANDFGTFYLIDTAEIKKKFPYCQLSPYLDSFDLVSHFMGNDIVAFFHNKAGRNNTSSAITEERLLQLLMDFHRKYKASFIKQQRSFLQQSQINEKKAKALFNHFLQVAFLQHGSPLEKDMGIYSIQFAIPAQPSGLFTLVLEVIKKIQTQLMQLFNRRNIAVIRKVHFVGQRCMITFFCLRYRYQVAVSMGELIKGELAIISTRFSNHPVYKALWDRMTKPDYFMVHEESTLLHSSRDQDRLVQLFRGLLDDIIALDHCMKVSVKGLYSFQLINADAFNTLSMQSGESI